MSVKTKPNLEQVRKMARTIIEQKGVPIPLPNGGKIPAIKGWQQMNVSLDQVNGMFTDGDNIGLRLDALTDCDLDCMEAVKFAPFYLKRNDARFGRQSRRNSHHFYLIEQSKSFKFANVPEDPEVTTLCEIRHGSGFQTMIPPSIHPNGEPLNWEGDPQASAAQWTYPELKKAMGRIAAGALLVRQLHDDSKTHGIRHHTWLYLGGAMARADWPKADALRFCELVCGLIGDDVDNRLKTIEATYKNFDAADKNIAGLTKLEEYLLKSVVRKLAEWLDLRQAKADPLDLSDYANAQTLFAEMGDELKFLPNESRDGVWVRWGGVVWQRDRMHRTFYDAQEILKKKADQMIGQTRDGRLAGKIRDALMNVAGVKGAMTELSRYPELAVSSTDFDSNPWLIGTQNGIFDLEHGVLLSGDRDQMISRQVNASYNPEAVCPRWLVCLERAQPDAEVRAFLQRLAGACLIGKQTEHGFIFNFGKGANFKTAFSEISRRIMGGDYASTPNDELFFSGEKEVGLNYVAEIFGKRLLVTNEKQADASWNVSFIKKLLGGQELKGRPLYCESFDFVPTARILTAANNKPKLAEMDEAVRRRFLLVPWSVTISEAGEVLRSTETDPANILQLLKTGGRMDFELLMSLLLEERDGIFTWMLAGCAEFVKRGLRLEPPKAVLAATKDYFLEEDTLGRFVDECCIVVPVPSGLNDEQRNKHFTDPKHGELSTAIYPAFVRWAQTGKYTLGMTKFTRRIQKVAGVEAHKGVGNRTYLNIILNAQGRAQADAGIAEAVRTADQADIPF